MGGRRKPKSLIGLLRNTQLGADLFAFDLLGPAYLIAFIHFASSFLLLDEASETHPPPRMRLANIFDLLSTFDDRDFSPKTQRFLSVWRGISEKEVTSSNFVENLALKAIGDNNIRQKLQKAVRNKLEGGLRYTKAQYKADRITLTELIDSHIAPVEFLDRESGCYAPASLVGILNAGWESYIGGLEQFAQTLGDAVGKDPSEVRKRFHYFLMKAMELCEVREAWSEARDAPVD